MSALIGAAAIGCDEAGGSMPRPGPGCFAAPVAFRAQNASDNHSYRNQSDFSQCPLFCRECPLDPQKRTYAAQLGMSALGQKRT